MNSAKPRPAILKAGITLYLIRHGETDWNREQRYQGQRDIPLNDNGRLQARRNGAALKQTLSDPKIATFVTSPLSRAVETMKLLRAEMDLDPSEYRIDDRLLELHYGHWEGHLASVLPGLDPAGVAGKAADPFGWRPTGGESYADLTVRISAWLTTLESDTVAISHGGVSRVARGSVLGLKTQDVPTLEVPQDKILVLRDGTMRWL